jgi:hypothetical protein
MWEQCSGLNSPLFHRQHRKTEGLCKFLRCVEQNCSRCVLFKVNNALRLCLSLKITFQTWSLPLYHCWVFFTHNCYYCCHYDYCQDNNISVFIEGMARSILQPNGDTLNATESISKAKKKCQHQGVSRHEVGQMWRTAYWHLEKRCRQRKKKKPFGPPCLGTKSGENLK